MFGLNSAQANAAMVPFAAAPVMQQRNQSILAASKMVGAGCATIALAGEEASVFYVVWEPDCAQGFCGNVLQNLYLGAHASNCRREGV